MYTLLPTALLILPKLLGPASAQPVTSPSLITPDPHSLNTLGFEPIDPHFIVLPQLSHKPLDEDQWLLTAVEAMAALSSGPITDLLEPSAYISPDPDLQLVQVVIRPALIGGRIEARYLIWGLHFAIKGAISTNGFTEAQFYFLWYGKVIGAIEIKSRSGSLSRPGSSSTNTLQRTPSSNQSDTSVTGSRDSTDLSLMAARIPLKFQVDIMHYGKALPIEDIILTIVESLLIIATRTPLAQVTEAIIVAPRPDAVHLHIIPYATAQGQPFMTVAWVALALKNLPGMLRRKDKWAEVHFIIKIDDVEVAYCMLVKEAGRSGSSPNGTSMN